jgi:hypothetical protein
VNLQILGHNYYKQETNKTKKMKKFNLILIILAGLFFIACSNNMAETEKTEESSTKEYKVLCDNQMIYQGPGEETIGLINETATKAVGADVYYYAWKDDRVELIEESEGWVKVKLVSGPNHVTGWLPETCIDK